MKFFKAPGLIRICLPLMVLCGSGTAIAESRDSAEVTVAKSMYAAFSSGDMEKVMAFFSPQVELIFHGPEHVIPHAGTWKGKAGVAEFFSLIGKHFEISAIDQVQFTAADNVVSVLGWENGVSRATGGNYTANWVHVITIEDDQIVRFEEVTDSAAIADALAPADVARGQAYFTTCLGCHGNEGEGMASMHAPRLTLLDGKYITNQLRNFRSSARGGIGDFYGWQMNGRATALPGDRAIRDVVAYIDTLPDTVANDEVEGDAKAGRTLYESSCAACHGGQAEGDMAQDAPRLAGMEGWYQIEQLTKFKERIRGSDPSYGPGLIMAASVYAIRDEQAMRDVVAYIRTLAD